MMLSAMLNSNKGYKNNFIIPKRYKEIFLVLTKV